MNAIAKIIDIATGDAIYIDKMEQISEVLAGYAQPDLRYLNEGDRFVWCGMNWVKIESTSDGVLCMTENPVANMAFGNTNCWQKSAVREWLNKEFIKELNADALCEVWASLRADNGDTSYGLASGKVCLLTADMFRDHWATLPRPQGDMMTMTATSCRKDGSTIVYADDRKQLGRMFVYAHLDVHPVVCIKQ